MGLKSVAKRFLGLFGRFLKPIPIIGDFLDVKPRQAMSALIELLCTVLLATTPIWVAAIWWAFGGGAVVPEGDGVRAVIGANIKEQVGDGILFIYSAALVAPAIYIAGSDLALTRTYRPFPSRIFHLLAAFLVLIFGVVYQIKKEFSGSLDAEFSYEFSLLVFWGTLVCVYILYCFKNMMNQLDPAGAMEESASNYSDGYSQYRRGGLRDQVQHSVNGLKAVARRKLEVVNKYFYRESPA